MIRTAAGGVRIAVKVVTRASKNRVAGPVGDRLKVCVTAPPEKGRANELVIETLADFFDVPARCVRIVAGPAASHKDVEIAGIDESTAQEKLAERSNKE